MSLKMDRKIIVVLCILILAGLVSSCQVTTTPIVPQTDYPPPTLPSDQQGNKCAAEDILLFLNQTDTILQQFDELGALVETTPPEDLLPLIQEMDALANNTDTFVQSPCVLKAKAALSEYFVHIIQGYLRVHAEALEIRAQSARTARDEFLAATDKLALFNKLTNELSELADSDNLTE